jgi:hypothetical protein
MSEQIEAVDESGRLPLLLVTVALPITDIRDETVKRFAATPIAQRCRIVLQ